LNKVLVVGPSWIGNMVMAQSLFITMKSLNPDVQIDVLAPAWTFPLLARMPEVNQSVAMPLGHSHCLTEIMLDCVLSEITAFNL